HGLFQAQGEDVRCGIGRPRGADPHRLSQLLGRAAPAAHFFTRSGLFRTKPLQSLLPRGARGATAPGRTGEPELNQWQMATARASVASVLAGILPGPRMLWSMAATWSLVALPLPVMLCFTRLGAYSATDRSRCSAAAMATPWARPNFSMLCTFLPKNWASMASSSG